MLKMDRPSDHATTSANPLKRLYEKASHGRSSDTAILKCVLDLLVRQALQHHADHAQVHPRLASGQPILVVAAHAPVAPDPGDRALHDPPPGQEAAKASVCHRQALVGEPDRVVQSARSPVVLCGTHLPRG
jgi:hypothetical protein